MSEAKRTFDFREIGRSLSNWGRWGDDDEIGTLNFVTPDTVREAANLVVTGKVFDLGMPLDADGPQRSPNRYRMINPLHLMMAAHETEFDGGLTYSNDLVIIPTHSATQWDALAHIGYDGLLYNGVRATEVNAESGATRLGIDRIVDHVVGRGVLLDMPRLHGVERLGPGQAISADDLRAAESRQNVQVRSGDILFVRTGWYQHYLRGDRSEYMQNDPGIDVSCCQWLYDRQVVAICGDNQAVEARPQDHVLLHAVLIRDMGMTLGEMFNLEDLAQDCAANGVWEFFFAGPPLKIRNATGAPLSPLAIK